MIILSLSQKIDSNTFFSNILIKIKDNTLLSQCEIKNNNDVYTFIYKIVVDDIKLFLKNEKNDLEESTKYMIQTVLHEIFPIDQKIEVLPFDKDFILYYLNILNNMKGIFSEKTDGIFWGAFDEPENDDEDEEERKQSELFTIMVNILGENAYNFIENMKNQKQNAIHKTELETIFNKRKLPEDIQKKILEFSYNEIIDGCK
jgi:hypothetical protein